MTCMRLPLRSEDLEITARGASADYSRAVRSLHWLPLRVAHTHIVASAATASRGSNLLTLPAPWLLGLYMLRTRTPHYRHAG